MSRVHSKRGPCCWAQRVARGSSSVGWRWELGGWDAFLFNMKIPGRCHVEPTLGRIGKIFYCCSLFHHVKEHRQCMEMEGGCLYFLILVEAFLPVGYEKVRTMFSLGRHGLSNLSEFVNYKWWSQWGRWLFYDSLTFKKHFHGRTHSFEELRVFVSFVCLAGVGQDGSIWM